MFKYSGLIPNWMAANLICPWLQEPDFDLLVMQTTEDNLVTAKGKNYFIPFNQSVKMLTPSFIPYILTTSFGLQKPSSSVLIYVPISEYSANMN
jgi:hypothetical protein